MPRDESKNEPNAIQARLEARERERAAKKPLTSKDLDNKLANAEERRNMELEQVKFKGSQMAKKAPNAKSTSCGGESKYDDQEEKMSHK